MIIYLGLGWSSNQRGRSAKSACEVFAYLVEWVEQYRLSLLGVSGTHSRVGRSERSILDSAEHL